MKNPPNKPEKSNGYTVSGLLKYIDYVLDDVRNVEAHQSRNLYVDKNIRMTLATAYHETKKYVEKIRAEYPGIKDVPADSTDPKEYLRNAHTWCVGQLYWKDGERIGVEKATAASASKEPAETGQSNKGQLKMIHPTPQNIVEIIEKLKTLQAQVIDLINKKSIVPDDQVSEIVEGLSISSKIQQKEETKDNIAEILKLTQQAEIVKMQREGSWPKDITQLMNEIEKLLFPYWDYLKEKGTSGRWEQASIEYFIKTGKPSNLDDMIHELEKVKHKMEVTEQKDERSKIMITAGTSKENWEAIRSEYDISKRVFGKKINFVSDSFKRKIIFRDVEHAFVLASEGFAKPAVILAGGVIEELLRLYLKHKNIAAADNTFNEYIKACKQNKLLQTGIRKLSDSAREFRNFVHLSKESAKKHSITKAAAKGAVSSIFIIANDL